MEENYLIRPYEKADRWDVLRISADTAVFGEPVEAILDDRRVFRDAFTSYYTDFEADYAWVACVDNRVVGYLTGCIDTIMQRRQWIKKVFPSLMRNITRGRYKLGRKTWRFAWLMAGSIIRKEHPHVDYKKFPAHLHINVEIGMRNRGLGQRLMEAYLAQLKALGVPGVHLGTTDLNEAACRLYERTDFILLGKRSTQVWRDIIDQPVTNLSYGLNLF